VLLGSVARLLRRGFGAAGAGARSISGVARAFAAAVRSLGMLVVARLRRARPCPAVAHRDRSASCSRRHRCRGALDRARDVTVGAGGGAVGLKPEDSAAVAKRAGDVLLLGDAAELVQAVGFELCGCMRRQRVGLAWVRTPSSCSEG
jgi:hypothetical protein